MHDLMMNLPVVGTLGVVALLAGPLARLPIVVGAWLMERAWTTSATIGARAANLTREFRGHHTKLRKIKYAVSGTQ